MDDFEMLVKDILESESSPATLLLILSRLREVGHRGLVIRHCRKALDIHPAHEGLRTLLAEVFLDTGLTARASDELERVTRSMDYSARAYALLARAYAHQGRHEAAIRCLKVYLAHNPEDSEAREFLENLRLQASKTAREPLEAAEVDKPDYHPDETLPEIATATLAELYYSQGQIDAAVATYEKVLARSPDDLKVRGRLRELKGLKASSANVFPDKEPGEGALTGPSSVEADSREGALVEPGRAASMESEKRKTEKMIAVLEEWLTRIQKAGTNASALGR